VIVLDTNVVSEPLRSAPHPAVVKWLDAQMAETLYLTVTSLAELKVGVALLPQGRRRRHLETGLSNILESLFGPRLLDANREAAGLHAELVARAVRQGIAISFADAQIAAIAKQHGFAVATRDVIPFEAAGIEVIDPWKGP
jgi:predicted nucleic acid-binding protein